MEKENYYLSNPEFRTFIDECFLDPLKELGFDFIKYDHHFADIDHDSGTHYLYLKEKEGMDIENVDRKNDWFKMDDICTQGDDGQPYAYYDLHDNKLRVSIPYIT